MFTLPRDYNEILTAKGIQCRVFNRFVPVMSLRLNNRDHRKLMIIDGKVGFTGGINLADEYINAHERFGHWKDSAILLEGDAVWSMTVMFLTMWDHCCGWDESFDRFRPPRRPGAPLDRLCPALYRHPAGPGDSGPGGVSEHDRQGQKVYLYHHALSGH